MRYGKQTGAGLVLAVLVATSVVATFHEASDAGVLPNGDAPMTEDGWSRVNDGGEGPPPFEIEGAITSVDADARRLTVNGIPLNVPETLNVDVGDPDAPSGDEVTWACFTAGECGTTQPVSSPVGWTAIAHGTQETVRVDGEPRLRIHLDHLFVERAENVILGVVTLNEAGEGADPERIWVNGVPVVMEQDPRFADFNRIIDDAGQPLTLADIPEGALAGVEGYFDASTGIMHARVVEVEFVNLEEGETDSIVITRAQSRDRGDEAELRVEGVASDASETISLYRSEEDANAGTNALATGITVGEEGEWGFRTRNLDDVVAHVYAVSTGGGTADAEVDIG